MASKSEGPNPVVILLLLLLLGVGGWFAWKHFGQPNATDAPDVGGGSSAVSADPPSSAAPPDPDEVAAASAAAQGFSYLPPSVYDPPQWPSGNWTAPEFANPNPPGKKDYSSPSQEHKATGHGYANIINWAPDMCFPLEDTPAYANSQVYGPGGYGHQITRSNPPYTSPQYYVPGSFGHARNFSYPWRDNFCELRSRATPYCNGGSSAHQGQDIRPSTNAANQYYAVATEDLYFISYDGVTLQMKGVASPHRVYNYLHLKPESLNYAAVMASTPANPLRASARIGQVSKYLQVVKAVDRAAQCTALNIQKGLYANTIYYVPGSGTNKIKHDECINLQSSIHLHFEMKMPVGEALPGYAGSSGVTAGYVHVPPYPALVLAYQRKLGGIACPKL